MRQFLKFISSINSCNHNTTLAKIAGGNLRCGLFVSKGYCSSIDHIVKNMMSLGIEFKCVYMPGIGKKDILDYDEIVDAVYVDNNPLALDYVIVYAEPYIWGINELFKRNNIKTLYYVEPAHIEWRMNNIYEHALELYDVYSNLDDKSKVIFLQTLKAGITGNIEDYIYAPEAQYLLEGFKPETGDCAIDGGAYDGESAVLFLQLQAKVIAFELDKMNYQVVKEKADRYGFIAENRGLGDCEKVLRYTPSGAGSTISNIGEETADIIDIDTYCLKNNIPKVDYIKLDVEGAELDTLKGAVQTIGKWKPKLAISAYHKYEDMWVLGNFIKAVRDDYKFAFRHYKIDNRNYSLSPDKRQELLDYNLELFSPTMYESILYCK